MRLRRSKVRFEAAEYARSALTPRPGLRRRLTVLTGTATASSSGGSSGESLVLPGRHLHGQTVAGAVGDQVDVGGQVTAGASDGVVGRFIARSPGRFPRRRRAGGHPCTIDESIETTQSRFPVVSARATSAVSTRSQVPSAGSRRCRFHTVCQGPQCPGRSRHGRPVRCRYSIASTTRGLLAKLPARVPLGIWAAATPAVPTVRRSEPGIDPRSRTAAWSTPDPGPTNPIHRETEPTGVM